MSSKDAPAWIHPGAGSYRRVDERGVVTQVGSHDWRVSVDVGTGMREVGICPSGQMAREYADDILSRGKLPPPPKHLQETFAERAAEKIRRRAEKTRRAGFGVISVNAYTDVEVAEDFTIASEGVLLSVTSEPTVALVVNAWGMKKGQHSYRVLAWPSKRILSDHDDMAWRYPQMGEQALDAAIAAAVTEALFGDSCDRLNEGKKGG